MAGTVSRLIQKNDPISGQLSEYRRTYNADGTFDATKDRYLGPVYQTTQGPPGASTYQLWLNAGHSGTVDDFLNSQQGQDAKQIAIRAGKLPANASDDAFLALFNGKPGADSTVPGPRGLPGTNGLNGARGNLVGAAPIVVGPVLILKGGAYVAALPSMLAALVAQLYLIGSDGNLYIDGLVPIVWPSGVTAGYRLVLQATTNGSNLLWLPPTPTGVIPATLGTVTAAYVDLGTAGQVANTVVFRPRPPYFDNSVSYTGDGFAAADYASVAAFQQAYTAVGSFTTSLYDEAASPSGRTLEMLASTVGIFRFLRSAYPSGSASFATGSSVAVGKKGGAPGHLVAVLRASGSGSTYTALEARLDTNGGNLSLYSVVNGTETQISSLAKGLSGNDVYDAVKIFCQDNIVRVRAWLKANPEPATWDIDTTQTAVPAAGLAGFGTNTSYGRFGFFGVSRGDANAPVS